MIEVEVFLFYSIADSDRMQMDASLKCFPNQASCFSVLGFGGFCIGWLELGFLGLEQVLCHFGLRSLRPLS